MTLARTLVWSALSSISLLAAGGAHATAWTSGTISATFGEAAGTCNKHVQVAPVVKDTLQASLSAVCQNGSVSGDMKASAYTASVGLRVAAAGTGYAGAEVHLSDEILFRPPTDAPAGVYQIPISFRIDGEVSPGAKSDDGRSREFLYYAFGWVDSSVTGYEQGLVTSIGPFSKSIDRVLNLKLYRPGEIRSAVYSVKLSTGKVSEGTIDFYNTASMGLSLPPGWAATTSSGLPLVSSVPEPSMWMFLLPGLGLLYCRRMGMQRARD